MRLLYINVQCKKTQSSIAPRKGQTSSRIFCRWFSNVKFSHSSEMVRLAFSGCLHWLREVVSLSLGPQHFHNARRTAGLLPRRFRRTLADGQRLALESIQKTIKSCAFHILQPIIYHGSLNVPIEHHPTIRYMVYNGYYKVMSNIPKMGHLPTPVYSIYKYDDYDGQWSLNLEGCYFWTGVWLQTPAGAEFAGKIDQTLLHFINLVPQINLNWLVVWIIFYFP